MRQHQKGITFIGWLFLLVPIAIVGYSALRLAPIYLNYMKVSKVLEQTAAEYKGEAQINQTAVRNSLAKRFDIDSITYPEVTTVTVARDGDKWVVEANYEDVVKLFANISLLLHFDKRVAVE
jgi:hypothetical protein